MTHRSEHCPELPASPGRIVLFSVAALVAGISLALWIDRPRGPVCTGVLAARTTYVAADAEGTLAEFIVRQGDSVAMSTPLVRLVDERLDRSLSAKQREIAALESELQRTRAAAELELNWRTRTLEAEICEIQLRSATFLKEKYDYDLQRNMYSDLLAGRDFAMLDDPHALFQSVVLDRRLPQPERLATVLQMEAAANAADVSAAQMEICILRQRRIETLLEDLPQQVRRTMGVDVAEASLARGREELRQLEAQQQELTIRSPAIGTVGVFKVRRGDHLLPGTPIVELLDESKRHLSVAVPSQEITSFVVGTRVKLTFPGNARREGEVVSVAPQARPADTGTTAPSDATVEVLVEPRGLLWLDVPIGSQVRVQPIR